MRWISNRDMRDRGYKGPFIIEISEEGRGFKTESEALDSMRKVLVGDLDDFRSRIKSNEEQIKIYRGKIKLIEDRLNEIK